MNIRKKPVRAKLHAFVGSSKRQPGQDPYDVDLWSVELRLLVEGEEGGPREVLTVLTARQVGYFLHAFPSAVSAQLLSDREKAHVRGTFETEHPNG